MKYLRATILVVIATLMMAVTTNAKLTSDGTVLQNLYFQAIFALQTNDWASWDAAIHDKAQLTFIGWGGGAEQQCQAMSKIEAFNSYQQGYNTSQIIPIRVMSAYDTLQAQVNFAAYSNPVGSEGSMVVSNKVMQMLRLDGPTGKKIYTWQEIGGYSTTPTSEEQLATTDVLAAGWANANTQAYLSVFSQDIQFAFWYEGGSAPAAIFNYTMFEGYSKALMPAGASSQALINKVAGGCNQLAIRAWMMQSKLDGQGPAAVQDSIMWVTLEPTKPYKWVAVTQILQNPPK